MEQLEWLSWRRFCVLYRNISPYGATAARAEELRKKPDVHISEEDGRSEATRFFAEILSTNK